MRPIRFIEMEELGGCTPLVPDKPVEGTPPLGEILTHSSYRIGINSKSKFGGGFGNQVALPSQNIDRFHYPLPAFLV